MLAVLNCETLKFAVLVATHVPIPTEYINVFVPIAANEGVITPVVRFIGVVAIPVVKVPPAGLTVIVTGDAFVQKSLIGVIVGVTGLTTVIAIVLVIGQFTKVGVTTTE